MSWLYSQALVGDCSAPDCSAGDASAPSSSTPTGKRSSSRGKKTACSILSRSGRTFAISTDGRGVELWMSSLRASRVSPSASPESNGAKTTNETSGPTPSASFAKWDRDSRCWRTSQGCLHTLTLEPFSETWPRAGITCAGTVSRRQPLAPITGETGCGSWPSPMRKPGGGSVMDGGSNSRKAAKARGMWPTPNVPNRGPESPESKKRRPNSGGIDLQTAVKTCPTPTVGDAKSARNSTAQRNKLPPTGIHAGDTLVDYVEKFPTPSARDWKSSNASPETMERNARPLNELVTSGAGGQLNPTWVEWLMGWPLGWTDLQPLETGRFQQWCEQHGCCSGTVKGEA